MNIETRMVRDVERTETDAPFSPLTSGGPYSSSGETAEAVERFLDGSLKAEGLYTIDQVILVDSYGDYYQYRRAEPVTLTLTQGQARKMAQLSYDYESSSSGGSVFDAIRYQHPTLVRDLT